MAVYISDLITLTIFIFFVIGLQCNAHKIDFEPIGLEDVKNQLFSTDYEKLSNAIAISLPNEEESEMIYDDAKCLVELKRMANSSMVLNQWAFECKLNCFFAKNFYYFGNFFLLFLSTLILVFDSWGKIPSGISSGNKYDFGAFSQCFNIWRENEVYKTQYCMANVVIINIGINHNLYDISRNYSDGNINGVTKLPRLVALPE